MPFWSLALAMNVIVMVCYLAIALVIGRGIHQTRQWRSNPLAVATFLIFLSCGVGHGTHVEHLLAPGPTQLAARTLFDVHLVAVDAITASIAIYYFLMRRRFPALLHGTAMYEDLTQRRSHALDIHDNIVQQLATSKLAFELGNQELGMRALVNGLESSKIIISDLIADNPMSAASGEPGGLRRVDSTPAP